MSTSCRAQMGVDWGVWRRCRMWAASWRRVGYWKMAVKGTWSPRCSSICAAQPVSGLGSPLGDAGIFRVQSCEGLPQKWLSQKHARAFV